MDLPGVFTNRDRFGRRMFQGFSAWVVWLLLIAPQSFAQVEKPRVQILWIQGKVAQVEPARQEEEEVHKPLEVFDALRDQDEISLSADSVLHYLLDERFVMEESRAGRYMLSAEGFTPVGPDASVVNRQRQLLVAGNWCVGNSVQGKHLDWSHTAVISQVQQAGQTLLLKQPVETLVQGKRPQFNWEIGQEAKRVDLQLWRLEHEGDLRLLEEWKNLGGNAQRPMRDLSEAHFHAIRLRESETMVLQSTEATRETVVDDRQEVLVWFKVFPGRREGPMVQAINGLAALLQRHPWAGPGLMVLQGQCLEREGLLAKAQRHWAELLDLHGSSRGVAQRLQLLATRRLDEPRRILKPILPFGITVPGTNRLPAASKKSNTPLQNRQSSD